MYAAKKRKGYLAPPSASVFTKAAGRRLAIDRVEDLPQLFRIIAIRRTIDRKTWLPPHDVAFETNPRIVACLLDMRVAEAGKVSIVIMLAAVVVMLLCSIHE